MSFSNNCKSEKIPGPVRGNALAGICEKTCVQVEKVFDACMSQSTLTDLQLALTDVTPTDLTAPYKFVSAKSTSTEATISDLTVTDIPEDSCYARVTCNVNIPVQVTFTDANGKTGTGTATVTVPKDVILHVSAPSVIPYSVQATVGFSSLQGTYTAENQFTVKGCATVILKITMPVDLLVPSYGYCYIPPCREYTQQACEGVFDLPLYPQECVEECRCSSRLKG